MKVKKEQSLMKDPATSNWLKEQLKSTKLRDPVDAINDAEVLVSVLKERASTIVEEQTN